MSIIREGWVNSCITIILGGYASRAAIHLKATQKRRFLIDDLGLTSLQPLGTSSFSLSLSLHVDVNHVVEKDGSTLASLLYLEDTRAGQQYIYNVVL